MAYDREKIHYKAVENIPFAGTVYSIERTFEQAIKKNYVESASALLDTVQGAVRDALTIETGGSPYPTIICAITTGLTDEIAGQWSADEEKKREIIKAIKDYDKSERISSEGSSGQIGRYILVSEDSDKDKFEIALDKLISRNNWGENNHIVGFSRKITDDRSLLTIKKDDPIVGKKTDKEIPIIHGYTWYNNQDDYWRTYANFGKERPFYSVVGGYSIISDINNIKTENNRWGIRTDQKIKIFEGNDSQESNGRNRNNLSVYFYLLEDFERSNVLSFGEKKRSSSHHFISEIYSWDDNDSKKSVIPNYIKIAPLISQRKIKLGKEIHIKRTLNSISDKEEISGMSVGWEDLEEAFRKNQEIFLNKNDNWAIRDPKLAEEFDYFIGFENKGRLTENWKYYVFRMKEVRHLEVDGSRAVKFLKKCIGDIELDIIYNKGKEIKTSDLIAQIQVPV